jgi:DNA-directed RNA polymerase specialized sigma24 family protein
MTFEDWVGARGGALLRFALMVSADPARAEDLVQSVLARVYPRWSHISTLAAPEAYVKAAIVNEHLKWWRRRSNHEMPTETLTDVNAGCPTETSSGRPKRVATSDFVDPDPVAISVFLYGTYTGDPRLVRSHQDTGATADALVTLLNAAQSVAPSECSTPSVVDTVFIVDRRDGSTQTIEVVTADSWLDNGASGGGPSGAGRRGCGSMDAASAGRVG